MLAVVLEAEEACGMRDAALAGRIVETLAKAMGA